MRLPVVNVGCMIMPEGPVGRVAEIAAEAEGRGCIRVWIPDEGLAARECHVTLAAVAAATSTIELGTGITNAYTRHPGVTAAAIATLDELSGGRAVLGVGAGGGLTLAPLAIERTTPLAAMRELVTTSRALWGGERVDHVGAVASFSDATLSYGRPDIAVWVAGRGPGVMRLGGEIADGFILSYVHKEVIGEHVGLIREAAADAGRPAPRIAYMTMVVTSDAAVDEARAALSFRLVDSPHDVKERIGMSRADTDAIREALATGGPANAASLVRDDWLDQFVLVGSPAECRAELSAIMTTHDLQEFQISISDLERADDALGLLSALAG